ncbi:MAG TPA: alpha/beta hydrolase [Verrucomicrobiae bacterium]|jgi:acetyl esterase/lipase|nr:alpha/beta hydrolase [Verrucomicrobiae bacterium]
MRQSLLLQQAVALAILLFPIVAFTADDSAHTLRGIEFARVADRSLKLDLHLPAGTPRAPLIVWIHGGAWRGGDRNGVPIGKLVNEGYAIASVDYRLSTEARFPAQIHDLKAALRFLRAEAAQWKLSADKIVVAGDSAGGHLAALMGVSSGDTNLEGTVGTHLDQSSAAQGIMSFYGGSDLTTILDQSTPHGLETRVPALDLLLGGQPKNVPEIARQASPVFYVNAHSPPLLLLHGDQDPQMPVNQALEFEGFYEKAHAPVQLVIVHGAGHGGGAFYDSERMGIVKNFLKQNFP